MNKLSLLLSGAVAFTAFISTSQANQELNSEYITAMERDLGISQAELPQYIQAEEMAANIEKNATIQFGKNYAGSWMERIGEGQYKYVVATTDQNSSSIDGSDLKHVNYSLLQLEDTMSTLNDTLTKVYESAALTKQLTNDKSNAIQSMYVDVKNNDIVIKVAPDAMEAAINFVALSKADINIIRIETSEGTPTALVNTYGGREYVSGGGLCSIGFPVIVRGSSAKGFVTAGHCGGRGTNVRIGSSNIGSVQRANYPGDDMAWASQRSSDGQLPFVTRYNGGNVRDVRVRGSRVGAIGASVCRSGRTTGYRCGNIQSRNSTVNYGQGPVRGLTQSTACAGRGDSGGSWITPAGQAQGVTSGGRLTNGNDNCSAGTPVTWFQPVREILNRYGLRLRR